MYLFSALCVQLTHPLLLLNTSKSCVQCVCVLLILRSAVTMTECEKKHLERPHKKKMSSMFRLTSRLTGIITVLSKFFH
jgi:hypothetical protein